MIAITPPLGARARFNTEEGSSWATWSDAWQTKDGTVQDPENLALPMEAHNRLICVGRNYADHAAEMALATTSKPNLFQRMQQSLVPPGTQLRMPHNSIEYDYEGEIGLVIGQHAWQVNERDALDHLAGLTLVFDGSVRDVQKTSLMVGKNHYRSGSLGPWISPYTGQDLNDVSIETRINGDVRQQGQFGDLIFSPSFLISDISSFMVLEAGDIISTGSPAGVGASFDPPKWLRPGDDIVLSSCAVGELHLSVGESNPSA